MELSLQQERSFPSLSDDMTRYLWISRLFYHDGTVHITSTFKDTISRCELLWMALFGEKPGQREHKTATGDAQFADVLRRLSVKFSYLREVWGIVRVRRVVMIGPEVHSGEERERLCQ